MTGIVFEALTDSPDTQADAIARLPRLQVVAYEVADNHVIATLPPLGASAAGNDYTYVDADVVVRLPAIAARATQRSGGAAIVVLPALRGYAADAGELVPESGTVIAPLPALGLVAAGFESSWADVVVALPPLDVRALEASGTSAIATLPPLGALALQQQALPANRALLLQSPGSVDSYASTTLAVLLDDALALQALASGFPGIGVRDSFNVRASLLGSAAMVQLLADNVGLRDAAALAWTMLLTDGIDLADTALGVQAMAIAIADTLRLRGDVGTQLEGFAAVIAGLALASTVQTGYEAHATDTVDFAAVLAGTMSILAELEDGIVLSDAAAGYARITALLADGVNFDDEALSQLSTTQAILDGFTVGASIRIGDEEFFAWVLHTKPVDKSGTRPVTEYQSWPFNSHARWTGKFYGAGDGGFFELEGGDDAGTPIDAWIRGGLSDLGTSRRKRVPEGLIAIDGEDGAVYIKIRHVDPKTGTLIEDWYDLIPETRNDAAVTREQRGKFQRGIKATWWGYELRNRNGAPFKAANLRFYPLILDGSS